MNTTPVLSTLSPAARARYLQWVSTDEDDGVERIRGWKHIADAIGLSDVRVCRRLSLNGRLVVAYGSRSAEGSVWTTLVEVLATRAMRLKVPSLPKPPKGSK